MKISKEHKLAFKISVALFFFWIMLTFLIPYFTHNWFLNNELWMWHKKYIILTLLSFTIYLVSYYLAKITIWPIEKNNKKLKEYNHNLAHELKTPLAVIKSDLELLEIWKRFDLNIIKSSRNEIISMQNIIDSLLFLAENNKLKYKKNLSFSKVLKKYLDNDIELIVKNDFVIKTDEDLIHRLLQNVIENAKKYKKRWTKILIVLDDGFSISNTVKNNIKQKDLNKIFDTFYQVDDSRNNKWYGLWLSIVKKITLLNSLKIKVKVEEKNFTLSIYS